MSTPIIATPVLPQEAMPRLSLLFLLGGFCALGAVLEVLAGTPPLRWNLVWGGLAGAAVLAAIGWRVRASALHHLTVDAGGVFRLEHGGKCEELGAPLKVVRGAFIRHGRGGSSLVRWVRVAFDGPTLVFEQTSAAGPLPAGWPALPTDGEYARPFALVKLPAEVLWAQCAAASAVPA